MLNHTPLGYFRASVCCKLSDAAMSSGVYQHLQMVFQSPLNSQVKPKLWNFPEVQNRSRSGISEKAVVVC